MKNGLYYNTVTDVLLNVLQKLMNSKEFDSFRLVGGTALSLQLGHRVSVDIDLFTDQEYGTINFDEIDNYLEREFPYVDSPFVEEIAFGRSYFIGDSAESCVKLDLFYTDSFIRPCLVCDGVRFATIEEIAAMKLDVVSRGGRKKDFWDIHKLIEHISILKMLELHNERYPYTHVRDSIIEHFSDFSYSDGDFDPQCLEGKHWEIIKLDIVDVVSK